MSKPRFFIALILLLLNVFVRTHQGEQDTSAKNRWNRMYNREEYIYGREPAAFLKQKIEVLKKGKALVLAMGEGRNTVYLAQNGFDVTGVDISRVAIEKCKKLAEEQGVTVNAVVADLGAYDMKKEEYDLITNFYYYDKALFPKIIDALKPGGMFILELFSIDHPKQASFGPRNPERLVKPNELLEIFKYLQILYYEDVIVKLDEGMHQGKAALIRLIAQKNQPF